MSIVTPAEFGTSFIGLEQLEPRLLLSGVTLITHGYIPDGARPAWLDNYAVAVADSIGVPGIDSTRYDLKIYGSGAHQFQMLPGPGATATDTGEVILTVDWAERSNDFTSTNGSFSTADIIAAEIVPYLIHAIPTFGLNQPLAELPVHLIGHSRGAAVMSQLAAQLGTMGVWVDQITFLDPHPLTTNDWDVEWDEADPQMILTENVVFADTYWRADGFNIFDPFDFDGQPASGAFNVELNESILTNSGYFLEHSDTHLFYYGTVDTSLTAAEGSEPVPNSWYGAHGMDRESIGFHYSRLGGGDWSSDDDPAGIYGDVVSTGYHALFGGGGSRVGLDLSGAYWPSVMELTTLNGATFAAGQDIAVEFAYQDVDSQPATAIGLDLDTNPYNENEIIVASGPLNGTGTSVWSLQTNVETLGIDPGVYHLVTGVGDGVHVKFAYAPTAITVAPSLAGDFDGSGVVDVEDINPFVLALTNPAGYGAGHPLVNLAHVDPNADGGIDVEDINAFVELLTGGAQSWAAATTLNDAAGETTQTIPWTGERITATSLLAPVPLFDMLCRKHRRFDPDMRHGR